MPSSPESVIAVSADAWQPTDLGAHNVPVSAVPRPKLFDVTPDSEVAQAVLEPARRAAQAAGYTAGWEHGALAGRRAVETESREGRERAERERRLDRERAERALAA